MPVTVPAGTKFMGVDPLVSTAEKRSTLSNSYQEFYTIEDIVLTASGSDTNIYNTSGTLTANRTVTMSGNTLNFSGGNIGINQPTPTVPLHIKGTAIPSVNESLIRLEVADATGAYLGLDNAALTNGEFVPQMIGRQGAASTQSAVYVTGAIDATQDAGTNPVTVFRSALASLASVVTRPIFQFKNWATDVMTILANGNVGIGTTTPTEKLEVSGKTKTTTFQMTTTPTAGYVLTSDASGNGTWAAAAGGLTKFTEAENTSAPNGTVYVDSLTAAASSTNADVAIRPKGNGALLTAIPDNTATGGNKRGQYAVDLNFYRTAANQVASGNYAFLAGGGGIASGQSAVSFAGTASGTNSTALQSGTSSDTFAFSHGSRATASGYGAVAFGGYVFADTIASGGVSFAQGPSTASGLFAIAMAESNVASAQDSCAIGGRNNLANSYLGYASGGYSTTNGVEGRQARGRALGTVQGETQKSEFFLSVRTTGNTATTVTVAGGAASTNNQVILSNQSAYGFTGTIVGKQSGSTNAAMWKVEGLIARGANAASTVLTTSTVTLVSNAPGWGTPTLAADTTNGGLQVQVIGATATNIQWTAVIETTEVIYA